jgi:RNA polymerase sigma-70 factor (ECF subfamily)
VDTRGKDSVALFFEKVYWGWCGFLAWTEANVQGVRMKDQPTAYLQHCLDRLHEGHASSRDALLAGVCGRLERLTHVMLKDYRRLQRWENTDDVLQNALIRLHRALQTITPPTLGDFYRLATLQIRRELLDLARHYYGPEGAAARQASVSVTGSAGEPTNASLEPSRLLAWTEFHQQVQELPEEEREVFDLIWYQGLAQTEAAEVLNVCARTVKRRWQAACLKLHDRLHGQLPGL